MNNIKGLICIDLWELTDKNTRYPAEYYKWIDLLLNNLQQFKFDSIINACYGTRLDYNDPSIYNTLEEYNWHEYDQDIMLDLIKNSRHCVLSKSIQENMLGKNSFALYTIDSFLKHHKKVVPHIKDWLVVGAHWHICTHKRALGLNNLAKLKELNFFGADWGFLKIDNTHCSYIDFDTDNLNWEPVDNLYKLKHQ